MNELNSGPASGIRQYSRIWRVVRRKLGADDMLTQRAADALHKMIIAEWLAVEGAADDKTTFRPGEYTDSHLRRLGEINAIVAAYHLARDASYLAEEADALCDHIVYTYAPIVQILIDEGLFRVAVSQKEGVGTTIYTVADMTETDHFCLHLGDVVSTNDADEDSA